MSKPYHKLIRDKIPQIIEATGKTCRTEVMDDATYLAMLDEKLGEELAEYRESHSPEELADLLEVIEAAAKIHGCSWEALLAIKAKKKAARGGFEEKLLLLEVSE